MADPEDSVCVSVREDGESVPLFVRPKDGNSSVEFLKQWAQTNKDWLDQKLLEHGAILFRGFGIREGTEFQDIVQQYEPDLSDMYRGTSPRKLIPGTQYVFTASEMPPFFPIPQHLEMSFLPAPPRKIFFCCLEAPTSSGGETCLCDFSKVYDQLDPSIRQEFEDKGVMHIRNYNGQKTLFTDPTMLKGWHDVFDTDDKQVVEEELRSSGQDYSWQKNDGLRIINTDQAVEKHPETGKKVWFNHSQLFHWAMIPDEFNRIYKRLGNLKYWFFSWLMWVLKFFFLTILGPKWVGFHTAFGDGSEIPEYYLEHLRDVIWKNMVFNRWELGDMLMIDNFRVSHGRQPYTSKRKVVVAWSQPCPKPSKQQN